MIHSANSSGGDRPQGLLEQMCGEPGPAGSSRKQARASLGHDRGPRSDTHKSRQHGGPRA